MGNTVTVDWSKVALAASPPLRTLAVSTGLPGLFVFLAALWWEPPPTPGWFTLTYRSAHGCWIGSKQIERGLKAHSGRIEQRIKIGDRWKAIEKQHLRNMTRSARQRDLACRAGKKGLKMLKYSVPFISSEGHEKSRTRLRQIGHGSDWHMEGNPAPAVPKQVGVNLHVQRSAGSVTFSTMVKTNWCGWARMSGTSLMFGTGHLRTNKIKSKVWYISGSLDTPGNIESALMDYPLLEPSWGRNWSALDTCAVSASVHMFHCVFTVGRSLTGVKPNQQSPPLLSKCPIPLFITSLCSCFE